MHTRLRSIGLAVMLGSCLMLADAVAQNPLPPAPLPPAGSAPLPDSSIVPSEATPLGSQTVKGEVLKIEDQIYVVKDSADKEVRLELSKDTALLGTFKPGDQIEAKLSTDGKVVAIKPADAR